MSIPNFLDHVTNPYRYSDLGVITDVESGGVGMISTLRTLLVGQLGWTEPSTALFKSPVDSAGRFMDLLFTRISATVMDVRLRNASGTAVYGANRRISINATTGSRVRIYCSGYHVIVESLTGNVLSSELLVAQLFDVSPLALGDISLYVCGNGSLSASSTNDGVFPNIGQYIMLDNGTATAAARMRRRDANIANGVAVAMYSLTFRLHFWDMFMRANFAGNVRWAGRFFHCVLVDGNVGYEARRRPSIDTNTRATFQTLAYPIVNNSRMMVRVDD